MSTKPFSIAVMAGGKSSRMGRDKSFVELLGKPLIEHLLERLTGLGQQETFIVSNQPEAYARLGLPIYSDVLPNKGSLGGIYTAVHCSPSDYTLVVACDMPFVSRPLLEYMIGLCDGELDVIVPRVGKYPEGLHALYHKRCLEPIREALEADRLKVIGFYGKVKVRYLDEPEHQPLDPQGLAFFNVNTPEELRKAAAISGEVSPLDKLLEAYQGCGRDALLPLLWEVETAFGYISPDAVHAISHTLRVPEADIYGVIGFYSLFHDQPTGETIIRVCTDPICGVYGADHLMEQLEERLGVRHGQTTPDGRYTLEHTTCLGLCDQAPAALISQRGQGETALAPLRDAAQLLDPAQRPPHYRSILAGHPAVMLAGANHTAQSLAEYGDYAALRRALTELSPEAMIDELQASGLIGRGGAAFPTGLKWKFARQTPNEPRYLICNADESEPGTFKDRALMEIRPHLVLEGMALAAYVINAHHGYLFIRGEYPEAMRRMQAAINEATQAGFLGDNILNSGFAFHIEIRRGAGAYICGEETALFEAIEGKRGFPRVKPPYPTTHGLFGQPTVINNVETLCAVPAIFSKGADWFKQFGTKLVSVSGHVARPGIYEITPGITLRQLLDDHCGGVVGGLKAVLMGGASGTFLTPAEIDVPLTFEDLRAAGSTFGSGAIMVFNEATDLRDVLRRVGRFFQHESCGKCFPCQLGTQRQMEILERLDHPLAGDYQRLQDIGLTMTEASLCGLGQTAAAAVLSAMQRFPDLFEEAVR